MSKRNTSKSAKKRVKVKELPAAETKLTGKRMKKVKGGWGASEIDLKEIPLVKSQGVRDVSDFDTTGPAAKPK